MSRLQIESLASNFWQVIFDLFTLGIFIDGLWKDDGNGRCNYV